MKKQNKREKNTYQEAKKVALAAGVSLILACACSPNQTPSLQEEEKPLVVEDKPAKVDEKVVKDIDKTVDKQPDQGKNQSKNQSQHETGDSAQEEPGVKNKDQVADDRPENITEQRKLTFPSLDIRASLPADLLADLKAVAFDNFNLDPANPQEIKDINSLYVLANKANYFPEDYVPQNLVVPDIPFPFSGENEKKYLQKPAAQAITNLIKAAAQEGIAISGVSGYRSIARQKVIYKYNVDNYGQSHADQYSAKPRYSEHHTGLCMDVSSASVGFDLVTRYGDTKEGKWLAENAHKYGFIIRYPKGKESITGYSYEPWHIRYLGVKLASYLYQNGLTYEEFIAGMQKIKAEDGALDQDFQGQDQMEGEKSELKTPPENPDPKPETDKGDMDLGNPENTQTENQVNVQDQVKDENLQADPEPEEVSGNQNQDSFIDSQTDQGDADRADDKAASDTGMEN